MEPQKGPAKNCKLIPLNELAVNVPAVIRTVFRSDKSLVNNLYAFGAVEGASIEITRRCFFGDPIIVRIKRSHIAIRTSEASLIMVETT
jgi:Fe2+ transport system protein FeoA